MSLASHPATQRNRNTPKLKTARRHRSIAILAKDQDQSMRLALAFLEKRMGTPRDGGGAKWNWSMLSRISRESEYKDVNGGLGVSAGTLLAIKNGHRRRCLTSSLNAALAVFGRRLVIGKLDE